MYNQYTEGSHTKQKNRALQEGTGDNVNQAINGNQYTVGDHAQQNTARSQYATGDNTNQHASGNQAVVGDNSKQRYAAGQNAYTNNENGENIDRSASLNQQTIKVDDDDKKSSARVDQASGSDIYSKRTNEHGTTSDRLRTGTKSSGTTYVDDDRSYANVNQRSQSEHVTKEDELYKDGKKSTEHINGVDNKSSATSETTDKGTARKGEQSTKTKHSDKEVIDRPGFHSTETSSSTSSSSSTFSDFHSGDYEPGSLNQADQTQSNIDHDWTTHNVAKQNLNGVKTSRGKASAMNSQQNQDSLATNNEQGSHQAAANQQSNSQLASTRKGSDASGNQQTLVGQSTHNNAGTNNQSILNNQSANSDPHDSGYSHP